MPSTDNSAARIDPTALWNLIPDGLVVVEPDGRIVAANPAASSLFGYEPIDLIGRPVETLVAPGGRATHAALRRRFALAPQSRDMGDGPVLEGFRSDNTTIHVQIALSPIKIDGNPVTLAVVRDVSSHVSRADATASMHDTSVQQLFGLALHLKSIIAGSDGPVKTQLETIVSGIGEVIDTIGADQLESER